MAQKKKYHNNKEGVFWSKNQFPQKNFFDRVLIFLDSIFDSQKN